MYCYLVLIGNETRRYREDRRFQKLFAVKFSKLFRKVFRVWTGVCNNLLCSEINLIRKVPCQQYRRVILFGLNDLSRDHMPRYELYFCGLW